jgi:hypothetical protein
MVRLLTVLLVASLAAVSHAAEETSPPSVLLVSDDLELQRAVPAALAPLGMSVIVIPKAAPTADPSSLPGAQTAGVLGTIWISAGDHGTGALNVRESGSGRTFERAISYSFPLAPADAASIALMARTMLGTLRGASEAPAEPASPPPAPRDRAVDPGPAVPPRLRIEAGVGARVDSSAERVSPTVVAAIGWYPGRFGVGLSLALSRPSEVATASFTGNVHDDQAAIALRLPLSIGSRVSLEPRAGISLHWIRVRGSLSPAGEQSVDEQAFDPGLVVGGRLALAVTQTVELALSLHADGLLRRQRYLYGPEEVLLLPRFHAVMALTAGLALR